MSEWEAERKTEVEQGAEKKQKNKKRRAVRIQTNGLVREPHHRKCYKEVSFIHSFWE
jgi:hypothetical protein